MTIHPTPLTTVEATRMLPPGKYTLDASHSHVGFTVRHAMITKVHGSFGTVTGAGVMHPDGSGELSVSIDASSVDTRNADRDTHLRSADFFDVATFPTITFDADSVHTDGDTLQVHGTLTIRDVARPVSFALQVTGRATDPFGNDRFGFEGSVDINRTHWGLGWNAALEAGGLLVSEKVTLNLAVSAVYDPA